MKLKIQFVNVYNETIATREVKNFTPDLLSDPNKMESIIRVEISKFIIENPDYKIQGEILECNDEYLHRDFQFKVVLVKNPAVIFDFTYKMVSDDSNHANVIDDNHYNCKDNNTDMEYFLPRMIKEDTERFEKEFKDYTVGSSDTTKSFDTFTNSLKIFVTSTVTKENRMPKTMYRYSIIDKAQGEELDSFDTDVLYHFPVNYIYEHKEEQYRIVSVHDHYTSVKRGKNFLRVVSIYVIDAKAKLHPNVVSPTRAK